MGKFFFVLTFLFAQTQSQARPCTFVHFQPDNMYYRLLQKLPRLNVAKLSDQFFFEEFPQNGDHLIRNGELVGQISLSEHTRFHYDPRCGSKVAFPPVSPGTSSSQTFTVTDIFSCPLAQVREEVFPCPVESPEGLCRVISISTTLDIHELIPYQIAYGPLYSGIEYLRYGKSVSATEWRYDLRESFRWLYNYLATSQITLALPKTNLEQKFFSALASDPLVAPYLPRLKIVVQGKRVIVRGVVPSNAIHDLIVDHAIEVGAYNIEPEMRIDTGTGIDPFPPFEDCDF